MFVHLKLFDRSSWRFKYDFSILGRSCQLLFELFQVTFSRWSFEGPGDVKSFKIKDSPLDLCSNGILRRSVLQCVAVYCSVLQYGAACCIVYLRALCSTGIFPPMMSLLNPWMRMYDYIRLLHRVAVCCSVTSQCVAVCCGVLQCVAVCCSMLQCVAVCCSALQRVAACCSVLQRVAACCSVLQRVATCCNVLQRNATCCTWTRSCLWTRSAEFGTKWTKRLSLNVCLQVLCLILLNVYI